ncbi:DUF6896 domain-containing protein [Chryseobacterium carnipullorum]|uniref:DUF6896 domain-containing protein n=1 Tax=Chryseobacterium carnipullorum TaxID=1124835 RepID=A0A376DQS0_CHRCU|nr:hypothetical protein [Chryseobacterium carnipullorum]STC93595.1 Uncharacterised protein [Chryseobacterium carnipullorum]
MERNIELITIQSIKEFPSIDYISNIPRHKQLRLIFKDSVQHLREDFGSDLKKRFPAFQIAIPTIEHEINICKLITDEEIIANQLFFTRCAKDYRELSTELINLFITNKKVKLNKDFPFLTFNRIKGQRMSRGKVGQWNYFFHGYHCQFQNTKTKQEIEVPFMFGMEFGDLDPYFFSIYIKSTPQYQPLPVEIYDEFADGCRILEVMLKLDLLEKINSSIGNHSGTVIKDREKIQIKVFNPETDFEKRQSKLTRIVQFLKFKKS